MNFPNSRVCVFVVILVLWSEIEFSFARNIFDELKNNYITWNDLIVNNQRLNLRDEVWNGARGSDRVIVVDKNGCGDSLTVQGAVQMVPLNNSQRVKIHILPGVYREKVIIPASKPFISFIGDVKHSSNTIITWHQKASDRDFNGHFVGTFNSATVTVESNYFCATGITFQNSVVAAVGGVNGYQAVAMRISGDKSVFYKVKFLGTQDTLLDEAGTHFFYKCFIQGATDFIFGNAKSLYKQCIISVVKPGFAIAAQHRNAINEDTGFSFVNCEVTGTSVAGVYLGRAWGNYSQIIYSNCKININVIPGGWDDWRVPSRHNTAVFGEYKCTGRGADRIGRVSWSRALSYMDAKPFMGTSFINGELWLRL